MVFFLFLFNSSGSTEVLGTESWVKMIKFGFLPLFSLFLDLSIFSVVWSTELQGPWSCLDCFFVLLECQWCKLQSGDILRVAYPISYLVFKYSNSGDFWAASGSLCQYFDIFILTQVFFYLFGLFGFWVFSGVVRGFPPSPQCITSTFFTAV